MSQFVFFKPEAEKRQNIVPPSGGIPIVDFSVARTFGQLIMLP